jgi:protein-disulfide isomerase
MSFTGKGTIFHLGTLIGLIGFFFAANASAQSREDIGRRLERVEQSLSNLQKEILQLNKLLRSALPPPPVSPISATHIKIDDAPTKGAATAKIALIEYSDFECPFCGQHANTSYREIQKQFVDTGKIRYVFRHLPLEKLHPRARQAAQAAECARDENRFWEFHDLLFENQKTLSSADLEKYASALNLNTSEFKACLTSEKTAQRIDDSLAEAASLSLTGTPAFLIGQIESDGTVRATTRISGAHPYEMFRDALDDALQSTLKR